MKRQAWFSLVFVPLLVMSVFHQAQPAAAQAPTISPSIFILSPREGQALQGIETIEGKIRGEGFISGKLSFSYAADDTETWFFIADIMPGAEEGSQTSVKVEWDTTQITDGNYHLRLVAEYDGSATIFELIPNLRVRNYSPVETSTPAPAGTQENTDNAATPTRMSASQIIPTPLPDNPAELESNDLYRVLSITGILVFGAFLIGAIYLRVKKGFR